MVFIEIWLPVELVSQYYVWGDDMALGEGNCIYAVIAWEPVISFSTTLVLASKLVMSFLQLQAPVMLSTNQLGIG